MNVGIISAAFGGVWGLPVAMGLDLAVLNVFILVFVHRDNDKGCTGFFNRVSSNAQKHQC